jgi:carboxyl-terminal processing protease
MIRRSIARLLLLAACSWLVLPLCAADVTVATPSADNLPSLSATNRSAPVYRLLPGPDDGRIAFVTAGLLQQVHYSHRHFDDAVSSEFLDRYLEFLDPQHLHFLQSDLAQFERYRTNLDDLTLTRRGIADTMPAYEIFSRFFERMDQRVAYAQELLKTEKFDFTSDEHISIDRHEMAYPQDLSEAKKLWRQRLRSEYLREKLDLESAPGAATNTPAKIDEKILAVLKHRYHRILFIYSNWNNEDVMGAYLTSLAHVYDPHSDYFNEADWQSFKISMNLELFGIGAELVSDEDGYCRIRKVLPLGPAAKSKQLRKDDRIVEVAQGDSTPVNVIDQNLTKIVQLIRGPKGTEVRLSIIPAGADEKQTNHITLIRDAIPLEDQAAKGKIIDVPNANGTTTRMGVIDLPSFYATMDAGHANPELAGDGHGAKMEFRSTSADITKLLTKFKEENVKGVILDLRRNGGGILEEAIKVTGLFIKDGPVVQAVDWDDTVQVYEDKDPAIVYGGPLIVLTSRFSASASEIVAGALQDYGRAIIVGDSSTHGKGTVQTVQELNTLRAFARLSESSTNDPGAVKITVRKFYRASGASTQKKGVIPDIVLPSVVNYATDIGESSLENPLPWDTTKSAKYDKLDFVQPFLSELLKHSATRIATNQDFAYVREDIERYRKQQADKTISLNEQQRLTEREQDDARTKAREKEFQERNDSNEKVYEITLHQADLPGLPPPVLRTNTPALKTAKGATGSIGTNALASVQSKAPVVASTDDDPDAPGKTPTGPDADLEEAKSILVDYLSLLPKGSPLLATQAPAPQGH